MLITKIRSAELPWALLAAEALLVVTSVLLALALEDWREDREKTVMAERALRGFVEEASENCRVILGVRRYHRAVVGGERKPDGLRVGLLRNDAWEVVKTTGAAAWLDHALVASMSKINADQTDHRAVVQAYLRAIFAVILAESQTVQWHREGERGVISELVRIQEDLLESYQSLQRTFNQQYGASLGAALDCPVPTD